MVKSKKPDKSKRSNKSKKKYRRLSDPSATFAKRTIFVVIIILTIAIVTALTTSLFYDNEKNVKGKITQLIKGYYEDYFYEQLVNSDQYKNRDAFEEIMEKYHVGALSTISLRDLLLYDNKKNIEYEPYLSKYCDKDTTTIRIFPDPPYERNTYHAEITYSCNF